MSGGFYRTWKKVKTVGLTPLSNHAAAPSFEETDWPRMVALYDDLIAMQPSPVAALNRAVAVAMADGPQAGIDPIESMPSRDSLRDYPPLYARA